ncbi:MAG TPA: hypothetical protein PK674_02915 [Candidatus Absconditabacterales bacterium]|nr:hypothetical protein [Candidatus Absconditabacterales bacterium]HOQ78635.1 hypothetical protein [Candidatus Absconditabacterales bacterium]HPK28282.1 hypothetical protein [Candidatus Absconditabacterales bacterium]
MKNQVNPFQVKVLSFGSDGKVNVQLPSTIEVDGEIITLKTREISVDTGKNPDHNIRRDIRKVLREKHGICVPFREQDNTIIINGIFTHSGPYNVSYFFIKKFLLMIISFSLDNLSVNNKQ